MFGYLDLLRLKPKNSVRGTPVARWHHVFPFLPPATSTTTTAARRRAGRVSAFFCPVLGRSEEPNVRWTTTGRCGSSASGTRSRTSLSSRDVRSAAGRTVTSTRRSARTGECTGMHDRHGPLERHDGS